MATGDVHVPCEPDTLQATLARPASARAVVLFAHGSGSSRHSTRNQQVARVLQDAGFATLLLDLLTAAEETVDRRTAQHRFDIALLTRRFEQATAWVRAQQSLRGLPVGYFGASTGSAVALVAAARLGAQVGAVVSRGGRPDLAGADLANVQAPTLLLVGGADPAVLDLNRAALAQMRCERELRVIPGATHLFEEPGTLEDVAAQAQGWFLRHLPGPVSAPAPAAPG